ncbi:ATP-binding protein [Labrys sp. (in: a-proteobacteria)]|uniref:ATP-binding protein n=1 Tax=Labrys sp. (in: a-proteobacteria) TaxID=1917972 RepID=UPI0039E670C4
MMALWRRSLAAQIITFMLLALAVSQGIGFCVSWDERGQAMRAAAKGEFFSRAASLALSLNATPDAVHDDILAVSGTIYSRFWLSDREPVDATAWAKDAWMRLHQPLPPGKVPVHPKPSGGPPVAAVPEIPTGAAFASEPARWVEIAPQSWLLARPAKFQYLNTAIGMGLAVQLDRGMWLNAAYAKNYHNAFWTSQSTLSLGITALVLSVIAIWVARSIARPMRRLATAAELLGRGEAVPLLPESGPDDIRQTAEAFNRMQARLQRFVEDRTRMLAAIGHDLRTPLTSLRLRAEFVSDPEIQDKMLKTIAEIQTMTESALAFAREQATAETTRTVDLSALVESLCDDLVDIGQNVAFLDGPKISYRCRPDALRRAVRNLVENAVRYGERARVTLARTAESIDIVIEDDGPGIPENVGDQVFAPFFRLEHSRNRETGGVGLGLSIARAIARHHGGDIRLFNQAKGLRAVIGLPLVTGRTARVRA